MRLPGIPDEEFIRVEKIPMTKEEIRVLALSKARLFDGAKFIDIGSGTGSVTVEAGLVVGEKGKVWAIEKDKDAVELTKKNVEKFKLNNVVIIEGEAPEALDHVDSEVDAIFIGGTERLEEILLSSDKKLKNGGRIVIDAILLETVNKALSTLNQMGYKTDVIEVIIAKGMKTSKGYAMISRNPIFIVYGEKP
ncbi:precorrin-6Y C5,15-methyltransferase (decarboxylating) subunit CbiT [Sulfurisphaera tokodaii]|uniref:Probable cobalt-precorrin-6B C(15)-methyltransferase (decarboxylating) n=2 Tax=Sulfurisphaera tokodaii TaxID=111955 RepID=CBIT_SULTO|nr:precorrin-6Y C5,15-methyltransferase (decarboxylating) subunit CbiT [Sulfurisphaera tokodaii]Q96ZL5.1 RecName: Full=Probable cobalt-precorrin-6B C(15)-methyltransferase (decarboxylating) [Sulfurisphaera tokodaii str. 7]BAK54675.1 probable cobalt-precorrin-6Y C(15)-methyltransferase [Sulfurisphaera tokodaii str. 7]HII73856.1 precorrin-6Y C5,15-methyltransferase (decarboxylating) subunit CbiT [Sulfurisphaera tokodaii]